MQVLPGEDLIEIGECRRVVWITSIWISNKDYFSA